MFTFSVMKAPTLRSKKIFGCLVPFNLDFTVWKINMYCNFTRYWVLTLFIFLVNICQWNFGRMLLFLGTTNQTKVILWLGEFWPLKSDELDNIILSHLTIDLWCKRSQPIPTRSIIFFFLFSLELENFYPIITWFLWIFF